MRALVLDQPGPIATSPLALRDVREPEPGPDEIVLRVNACAVCRTDLQLCEGDLAPRRLPIVPGHQVVGVVRAVGSGVGGWKAGDRAGFAWLGGTCGTCRYCLAGDENLCLQAQFTGWDRDGGYAEMMVGNAAFALHVPDGFSDIDAAPLLCGGVIGFRSLRRSAIRPGGRLGLYGYGASARLAIQVARHWGCEVFVCTRSKREQDRALKDGALWAGGYDEEPPVALDAAVTFAPAGSVVVAALRAVDRGGTVAINAIHLDHMPEFPYDLLWWERNIRSVANFTRRDARELLALAAEIPIRTEVEVMPLTEANGALARLGRGDVEATIVLVP
jgi:alcohol dehydrogenase, propanol-preferring